MRWTIGLGALVLSLGGALVTGGAAAQSDGVDAGTGDGTATPTPPASDPVEIEPADEGPSGGSSSGGSSSGGSSSGGGTDGTASGSGRTEWPTATGSSGGSGSSTGGSAGSGSTRSDPPAGSTVRTYEGRPVEVVTPAPVVEEEEAEGDGRDVDFIYLEVEGGVANVNLIAFGGEEDFTMSGPSGDTFSSVASTGGYFGAGVGFRVFWLAIGGRFNFALHDTFQLGIVGGDATLRFPIPIVEPYIRAGFGYAWQGNATYTVNMPAMPPVVQSTTVYGWAFDAAVGFDIYLANWFTIGAGIGLDILNMARQTDPRMMCMGLTDICPSRAGDAVGYQLRGFGMIAFRL